MNAENNAVVPRRGQEVLKELLLSGFRAARLRLGAEHRD